MAAVAARVATVKKESTHDRRHSATKSRRKVRRCGSRFWSALKCLTFVLGLALLFGYVSVYANLTMTSYSKDKLMHQFRQERIKNERLRVELARRSSPQCIVVAAQEAGMVYATQYDYIKKPERVASAKRDR